MSIQKKTVNYFTCILCFLLLIVIILSKNTLDNENLFYFLIIVVLLIIISCLLDLSDKNLGFLNKMFESFSNMELKDNRVCYERSKEHQGYNQKIDSRLDKLRELEENDRKEQTFDDEDKKLKELKEMNEEYLVNGESF